MKWSYFAFGTIYLTNEVSISPERLASALYIKNSEKE